jgi:hypothetical protein
MALFYPLEIIYLMSSYCEIGKITPTYMGCGCYGHFILDELFPYIGILDNCPAIVLITVGNSVDMIHLIVKLS